jgi:hypothetical protein
MLKKGKKNVGSNIREEKRKHPEMDEKQILAIALSAAGIKPKKKAKKKKKVM